LIIYFKNESIFFILPNNFYKESKKANIRGDLRPPRAREFSSFGNLANWTDAATTQ